MEGYVKSLAKEMNLKIPEETIDKLTGVSHIPDDYISQIGELDVELNLRIRKVN